LLAVLAVVGGAFAGSGIATCGYMWLRGTQNVHPGTTTVLRGTSAVVSAIRDLAVLETASYHMERVIDLRDKQSHLFGLFESEDALLLVAAADVVAGVDLSALRDGDIRVDAEHHSVSVRLPEATILSAKLDNDSTYVHSRSTDRLAVHAKTLETRARQEAEHALRDAALRAGILRRARDNAQSTLTTLLHGLGFDHVQLEFRTE
jgi:Protein of unknown function (DUF4230)